MKLEIELLCIKGARCKGVAKQLVMKITCLLRYEAGIA